MELLCILAVFFCGIYAIAQLFGAVGPHHAPGKPVKLEWGWYRVVGDREIPVHPGDLVPFGEDESVTVFLPNPPAGTITTKGALYRIRIEMDGGELYRYDDSAFPCNDQMRTKIHCDASLPESKGDRILAITYFRDESDKMVLPPVYCGTSSEVFLEHILEEGFTLTLIAVMLLCAITCAAVFTYLTLNQMKDMRFLDMTVLMLLCSVWCFCDSALARYLSRMSPGVEGISFYAFMTLGIPFVRFISNTVSPEHRRSLRIVTAGFAANIIAQTVLWATGAAAFIELLPLTHICLAVGIIVCSLEMHREYRQTRDPQLKTILLAFGIVGLFGVLALVLYWLFRISFYGVLFEVGILGFILLLVGYLCVVLVDGLRFKAEAKIYERLSREDSMTGLQNRRGFDEYLRELAASRGPDTDATMYFLDINGLKEVNDQYGHRAGDELIVGTARCLENAFGSDGKCFRLGGDEFCVIVPGSERREAEHMEKLGKTVERYNQIHRIHISLADGSSRLKDENGEPKSLSDWKQHADQQMYEKKNNMKRKKSTGEGGAGGAV